MGKVSYYHTKFIKELAADLGLHEKTCIDQVVALTEVIADSLRNNDKVVLRGFGSWHITKCAVRHENGQAHNNKRCAIVFKPSPKLVTKHNDDE